MIATKDSKHINGGGSGDEMPSHQAIDNGNPANFAPKWLVLDDVNIDLITFLTSITAIGCFFLLPAFKTLAVVLPLALLIPLRLFFPRSRIPEGLVLITGASSGIGAELSYIFAERGHDLVLVGRNDEQLEAVRKNVEEKYGRSVFTVLYDLSMPGAAKELYDDVVGRGYKVDVLVNCAGLGGAGDTFQQPIELTERMTILNCVSLVQLTQLFGNDMIKRGRGWLLQVSSVGGFLASPGQNIYHASKHYVRAFSEALSLEVRAYPGIVNTQLLPGPTHTQFITRAHAEEVSMMAAPGVVEDPKAVAQAGYSGLCKGKRMVFSSWNSAITAFTMQLAPRSVQLTMASFMNAPLRGLARANEPQKDQKARGESLVGNNMGDATPKF